LSDYVGKIISHYRIYELIGRGGMGVVYKAEDTKLKRTVALKFLPPVFSFDQEAKKRFINEAQAASALQQHNICTIHEISESSDGQLFIVMDYYEGQTLNDRLKKSKLKLDEFFNLAAQIAEGISWAHKFGIIHRDIKPANILITKDGVAKILDFGLAKLSGQTMMTKMGSTMGTVAYMSPEQARGEDVDHRTDIWSFGVVMYEMLTGKPPFSSEYEQAMIYSILNEEIKPISPIEPDTNPELDTLIMDCLEKDLNERCQSAAEIRRKLKLLSSTTNSSKIKSVSKAKKVLLQTENQTKLVESSSRKWKWFAVALMVLMAIALTFFLIKQLSEPLEVDLSIYKFTPIATDAEPEWGASWSPDGSSIAYLKTVNGYDQIFIRKLDNPLPNQITFLDKKDATRPFWSPDGSLIYFISNLDLCSTSLTGGEPKKILDSVYAATISPNSEIIAYCRIENIKRGDSQNSSDYQRSIYIYSLIDSSNRKYQPSSFELFGRYYPNNINFSPDGKKIGFSTWANDAKNVEFWILDWTDWENTNARKTFLMSELSFPSSFSWFPDSRNIVLSIGRGGLDKSDLGIGDTEKGQLVILISAIKGEYNGGSLSPDGKQIALTRTRFDDNIISIPYDGTQPKFLMATSQKEMSLSFSDDGSRSVYITNRNGNDEIWLRNNEEDIRPIFTTQDFPDIAEARFPVVNISPDGNLIAFEVWGKEFSGKIFIAPSAGGKAVRLLKGDNREELKSWSPDGKFLLVELNERGNSVLATVKIGAQEPPNILKNSNKGESFQHASFSPDGRWIYYYGSNNNNRIKLISPDGKIERIINKPRQISNLDLVTWSKDGFEFYIISIAGDLISLYRLNINSQNIIFVAEHRVDYQIYPPGYLSPNGTSIIAATRETKSDIWLFEGFPQP
jgi:eukaryotic-like serine/threonine-protein kinase